MHDPIVVGDLADSVTARISSKSRPTYRPGLELLVRAYGDRSLDDVTLPDLEALRDQMRIAVGEATVRRALARGRPLRSYDPDAHGQGAAENLVRAVRFFFRYAVAAGLLERDPSAQLRAPRRHPAPERPLTERELAEVWTGALLDSSDRELDELLLRFLRRTAARREGCINLCLDHLIIGTRRSGSPRRAGGAAVFRSTGPC